MPHAVDVADVAEEEAHPLVVEGAAHQVLLGLVAAEDVDLRRALVEEVPGHHRAERAGAAGDGDGAAGDAAAGLV